MTDIQAHLQGTFVEESNNTEFQAEMTVERTRWESDGLGSNKLFAVPATSPEFVDIESQFLQTLPRSRIKRIESPYRAQRPVRRSYSAQRPCVIRT